MGLPLASEVGGIAELYLAVVKKSLIGRNRMTFPTTAKRAASRIRSRFGFLCGCCCCCCTLEWLLLRSVPASPKR